MIADGDKQALELWSEWAPTVMTSFPHLDRAELNDLYHYLAQYKSIPSVNE